MHPQQPQQPQPQQVQQLQTLQIIVATSEGAEINRREETTYYKDQRYRRADMIMNLVVNRILVVAIFLDETRITLKKVIQTMEQGEMRVAITIEGGLMK
jgi:phage baseplate assembly protein W